jgi:hypothetical protein
MYSQGSDSTLSEARKRGSGGGSPRQHDDSLTGPGCTYTMQTNRLLEEMSRSVGNESELGVSPRNEGLTKERLKKRTHFNSSQHSNTHTKARANRAGGSRGFSPRKEGPTKFGRLISHSCLFLLVCFGLVHL